MTSEIIKIISNKDITKDFYLSVPTRLCIANGGSNPAKIRLRRIKDTTEYVYVPRSFTFLKGTFLTIEELEAIVKKLKELNNLTEDK